MSNYIQEVPIERDLTIEEKKKRSLLNMALQPGRDKNVNSNDFTKTPLELNEEEKERRAMRLAKKFEIQNNKYLYKDAPHGVAFKDDGKKIVAAIDNDDRSISGMVELAKAKGWDVIKVSGDREFKQKAWLEAKLAGLEVNGYKPNEKDLKALKNKENGLSKGDKEQGSKAPTSSPSKGAPPIDSSKNKVFEGTLVEHGVAPYKGDKNNSQSYYAVVRTEGGDKTVWGKELANVIGNSGNKVGDEVKLEYTGKKNDQHGSTKNGKVAKVNGWKINDSKEVVAVKAVADAFVDKNIKKPSEREAAKQHLYDNIDRKARSGTLPEIKIYDKSAERDVKIKSSRSVDVEAERVR